MEFFTAEELYERYNISQLKIKDFELFEMCNKLLTFINSVEDTKLKEIYKQVRISLIKVINNRLKEFEK